MDIQANWILPKRITKRKRVAMKPSFSLRECAGIHLGIRVAIFLAGLLTSLAVAAQTKTAPPAASPSSPSQQQANTQALSAQEREDFRNSMLSTPLPGKGCFTAHYPTKAWIQVQCLTAAILPFPHARGARPAIVGNGNDYLAEVTSGNISSSEGSFDSISGVTAEYGSRGLDKTTVYPDTFSLQLNSNDFATPLCNGKPGCVGWQQFVFSQSICYPSACTFIEYWLINYTSSCPNGWISYDGSSGGAAGCYRTSAFGPGSVQALNDLGLLTLTGKVDSGGTDTAIVSTASGEIDAMSQDSILDLAQNWKGAEFNLFGDCCASEAYFVDSGSSLVIRLTAINGTQNAPICSPQSGTTAETNSLILTGTCNTFSGVSPAIMFSESGGGPLPPAINIGGPHLWSSLGGQLWGNPVVAQNADGRLEVFAVGPSNALYHIWQLTPGGAWSGWSSLNGNLTGNPVVGQNADGRLEVFAAGTSNALYHIWQQTTGGWSGWSSLNGNLTGNPVVGQNADGRLEVFAAGTSNALYHIWQQTTGGWSGWSSLNGNLTGDPVVARNADGRLEVFAAGTSNALYHIWQQTTGGWSGWSSLNGYLTGDPVVARNADGRLEVFARGTSNALYHIWQQTTGGWSGWSSLNGNLTSDPVVGQNADGRLDVFAGGTSNAVYHIRQLTLGGAWSGWNSLDGAVKGPPFLRTLAVGRNADGRLDVFAWVINNALYHIYQPVPGNW
jgi:hypothetical protein